MSLRHIFAKLLGNTAETAPLAVPYAEPPVKQPPVNATMAAIRASDLDTAVMLMKKGGEVDFGDPAIETQMRVATYEANFEFLQALEERRTVQQAAALRKQTEQDNADPQEAQGPPAEDGRHRDSNRGRNGRGGGPRHRTLSPQDAGCMTKPKYSILDSFRFISAVSAGDMPFVLEVFADNPDAWKWREDRDDDYSVLHHAISGKQPAMVDLMIRKGAELELGARNEMKPLMLAARSGDAESVALLLEAGADAAAKDSEGRTALDYSQQRKTGDGDTAQVQKWLVEAMENPAAGRAIKSRIGMQRVAETKDIFNKGAGKPMTATVARFRKKAEIKL